MFTSSVSGEGKTFCSINTATVYALSGKKTVIVGLDLRKPKIFDDFKVKNNKGAVNYLINDSDLDGIIHQTHIPNLDVILSGPIPPNPSELLMRPRTKELLDILKQSYDLILIDSAPLLLVSDTTALLPLCDSVVYVTRSQYSEKKTFPFILDMQKRPNVPPFGMVLNGLKAGVSTGSNYGYKYRYSYRYTYNYGYGYGYGSDADTES